MAKRNFKSGFSIAEILIAVGILAVAMIMIAGVFPVGIRFTRDSIDRTMAAIAANEAFAKIQLIVNKLPDMNEPLSDELSYEQQRDCNDWFATINDNSPGFSDDVLIDVNTFSYPTDPNVDFSEKQYCWAALLRMNERDLEVTEPEMRREVQVTVFVSRRMGQSLLYYAHDFNDWDNNIDQYGKLDASIDRSPLPMPVRIEVQLLTNQNELRIADYQERVLIDDGCSLVDDRTGRIYRVMERYKGNDDDIILLDRDFIDVGWDMVEYDHTDNTFEGYFMWVLPSAYGGGGSNINVRGKSPCVGVYQKVLRF